MAREKHMDGIFNPLITRNFIRLWQPFSWRRWLALGLLGCPSRCALHGQLLLTPPFCRRILFTTARVACFFAWSSGRDLSPLPFVCFSLSLSLPPPLLPPLVCRCRCLRANFLWLAAGSRVDVERGVHDDYTVECEDGSLSHPLLSHSR